MEKINKEIVLLLINGSHSAFSKIYVKCHRQFFLLALRYLKSKEMAGCRTIFIHETVGNPHPD